MYRDMIVQAENMTQCPGNKGTQQLEAHNYDPNSHIIMTQNWLSVEGEKSHWNLHFLKLRTY